MIAGLSFALAYALTGVGVFVLGECVKTTKTGPTTAVCVVCFWPIALLAIGVGSTVDAIRYGVRKLLQKHREKRRIEVFEIVAACLEQRRQIGEPLCRPPPPQYSEAESRDSYDGVKESKER